METEVLIILIVITVLVISLFLFHIFYRVKKDRKSNSNNISIFDVSEDKTEPMIVNNFVNVNIRSSKPKKYERSEMEKILIKNAKIDALASINPTDTKKSKEQIEILKLRKVVTQLVIHLILISWRSIIRRFQREL